MPGETLIDFVNRLSGRVIVSSDITQADLENVDIEPLVSRVIDQFDKKEGAKVLGKEELARIIGCLGKEEKGPVRIEVIRSADFKPSAKDIEPVYSIKCPKIERATSTTNDFVEYFNDRFNKLRDIMKTYSSYGGMIRNIDAIRTYIGGREFGVVGIVYDKITTRNGHILVTLEDESAVAKVLFYKPMRKTKDPANELFELASKLVKDDTVYIKGKVSGPFVIASRLAWPDVPVRARKGCDQDISIAFISDTHVGSKLFLERQFGRFIEWLNGNIDNRKDIASKIKYLVMAGDLVDGVGVYPDQEKELAINDIYKQYSVFFDFMKSVPDYIEVFLMPGNHDAVQRAEPQPQVSKALLAGFDDPNVHILPNPCSLTLHGVKVLSYHGCSLDSIIRNIQGCTYADAAGAMKEIIKRRHLSPIYGDNVVIPSKSDPLVIEEVPDILHMGHIHKNGYDEYHGTAILNSGTWQARTAFQIKQGHIPSPCLLPVYDASKATMGLVNFNEAT